MRLLFQHGMIYTGERKCPLVGDVLIENDRILSVGERVAPVADKIIDCTGLCIAPGLIDAHSHNDFFYDLDDAETYYRPFLQQGITTQVTGNCGFSPFGVSASSPYQTEVGGGLFHAKHPGTYADFLGAAQGRLFVNFAPLIGHGTARISVSGLSPRPLTAGELEAELALVEEAMRGGAFGGSFGFMYEPGMYAPKDECVAFAKKIAEYDGILTVHPRACSKVALGYPLFSKPHIELALDEVLSIMRASDVRTEYSHLIFVGETSWKSADKMFQKFKTAREQGLDIAYDNYSLCYGASVITVICPPWYMALPKEKRHTAANRARLRVMIDITRKALGIDYDDITVAYISEQARGYEGRTIAQIAHSEGVDPLDLYLRLVDLSNGQGRVYMGKYYHEALIRRLMEDKLSLCMTDAWVEPSGVQNAAAFQCYPNFFVLAKRWGIPLENIIYKMTKGVADRFHIQNRGELKKGNFADIVVFSKSAIRVNLDQPDFAPEGIRYVLVNGVMAVDDGKYVSQRAGRVLKKG